MRSLFALREKRGKEPRPHDMIKQVRLGSLLCELYGPRNQWRVRHGDARQQTCRKGGLWSQVSCTHFTLSYVFCNPLSKTGPILETHSRAPPFLRLAKNVISHAAADRCPAMKASNSALI
jgi:hypothetical protein